jgi:imidazolonepropionase-like amidohydrolase
MRTVKLLCGAAALVWVAAAANPLVVRDVTVFDSEARQMRPRQVIVMRGDRIETLGESGRVPIPKGATILDGRGKYAIPGLIDAHAHVVTILHDACMTGDEILPYFLANGVVAIREAGDMVAAQKLVCRYADAHPEISPRIFMASPLIGNAPPIHQEAGWTLTKPEQVPAFVSHMVSWGVTSLKIYANCLPEVARRVIEEGHRRGLMVMGHLSSYPAEQAVGDEIDSIEHIESVSDFLRAKPNDRHSLDLIGEPAARLIRLIAERGTFVDPTLMVYWGTLFFADSAEVIGHPDNAHMPERLLAFWAKDRIARLRNYSSGPLEQRRRTFEKYKQLTGMLHRAGVRLLVGTDAPEPQVPPGWSLHHELELLIESGVPPGDALRSATLHNALALKQERNLGSIRAGKLADIVLLDANPLEDIRNTRKIYRVIKGTQVLDPAVILRSAPRQ